jgi:hypothetical protein
MALKMFDRVKKFVDQIPDCFTEHDAGERQ